MFHFTPAEKTIVIFLVISAFVGSCVVAVKKMNPEFAEEINLGEKVESQQDSTVILELEEGKTQEDKKQVLMDKININTAGATELQLLPKVGASTAERILQHRRDFGNFTTIEEITNVKGIGDKTLEVLRPHITVGNAVSKPQPIVKDLPPTPEEITEKAEKKVEKDSIVVKPEPTIININTATKEELMILPGIGKTYADRIIAYRDTTGGFEEIDDLKKVKGIGEKKFAKIKNLITVE